MVDIPIAIDQKHKTISFDLAMANRHGLITGATGTGKTVTMQKIAEQFSNAGVCIFAADIKGDLSGIAFPANDNPKIDERLKELKITSFTPHGNPVIFWDIYGNQGHPLRTTVSEMGPLLFGRILNVNETQQGIINAAFSYADDEGLLLLDLKDFRSLLEWMSDNAEELRSNYGNITSVSIGAIQRNLLSLQEAGGDKFFGEPAFDVKQLFQKDSSGKGIINILDATNLINDARLYSTFLLWMLSELFEQLPEVGDLDQPKLVFFFDEAHVLFDSAPKSLLEKIEQLVRLIRSKGVGVYFVTQSPLDITESVLRQLGNRLQHALRAYTPKEQKAIRAVAETFRKNPQIDIEATIRELGVGEILISLLDNKGIPDMVDQAKVIPPESRIGPITSSEREVLLKASPFFGKYEQAVDRESAYEMLKKRNETKSEQMQTETVNKPRSPGRPRQTIAETLAKSTARSLGNQLGRTILRGVLGTIFKNN